MTNDNWQRLSGDQLRLIDNTAYEAAVRPAVRAAVQKAETALHEARAVIQFAWEAAGWQDNSENVQLALHEMELLDHFAVLLSYLEHGVEGEAMLQADMPE